MTTLDGEEAIDLALQDAYPAAPLLRFTGVPGERFQLAGIVVTRVEAPVPHWVIVSRGFTELHEKEEVDPDVSGWGFELSCRVPATSDDFDDGWVANWMQSIAEYLAASGAPLEAFHHKGMTRPTSDDECCGLVFVPDALLRDSRSKTGAFSFLQMVGLTSYELEALRAWDARQFVDLMKQRNPLLLTDPRRPSYLRDPAFARAVEEGIARDGSSTSVLSGVHVLWFQEPRELQIHLREDEVQKLERAVHDRLRHGRHILFLGDRRHAEADDGTMTAHRQTNVALLPETGPSCVEERNGMEFAVLRCPPSALSALAQGVSSTPGSYVVDGMPGVRFVVASSQRFDDEHYPF